MRHLLPRDPRWFQIVFLGSFVAVGLWLEVIPWWQPLPTVAAALLTQLACVKLKKLPNPGHLSPLITGLGLTLLVRSDLVWLPPATAILAIGSKFFVRWSGKHLFNPANLGLAASMLLTSHAWASPSQWGESAALMFWFLALVDAPYDVRRTLQLVAAILARRAGLRLRLSPLGRERAKWICTDAVLLGLDRHLPGFDAIRALPLDWVALGSGSTNDLLHISARHPELLRVL